MLNNKTKLKIKNSSNLIFFNDTLINSLVEVPPEQVELYLKLYPPKDRIVKNIKYCDNVLYATLIPLEINYSIAKPDYFTAVQLLEAFSQLGYILGGLYFLDRTIPEMPKSYYLSYLNSIENLKCYYTQFNFSFKKKLLKKDYHTIIFYATDLICTSTRVIIDLKANIGNSFFSEAKLFCSLNPDGRL